MRSYAIGAVANGLSDLIHSESDSTYTTERLTMLAGDGADRELVVGEVISLVEFGAATVTPTAHAGNTGNGAIGTWTADDGAQEGTYKLVIIEPGSNAGEYQIERPDGTIDGTGTVGVAYNGMINGTLADGGTDFAAGDGFDIVVSFPEGGKVVAWDPAGTDGSQVVRGLSLEDAVTEDGVDGKVNVLRRGRAIVRRENIVFPDGATSTQKAAVYEALEALGIVCRVSG